jgi:hypothetical protein
LDRVQSFDSERVEPSDLDGPRRLMEDYLTHKNFTNKKTESKKAPVVCVDSALGGVETSSAPTQVIQ